MILVFPRYTLVIYALACACSSLSVDDEPPPCPGDECDDETRDDGSDDRTATATGRVALWDGAQLVLQTVELPLFQTAGSGYPKTDLIEFVAPDLLDGGVPTPIPTLQLDEEGCYCYERDSHEFAYVHATYYAHRAIADYNQALVQLGLAPLPPVELGLGFYPGLPDTGYAEFDRTAYIDYHDPAIEPSIIAHEIAHLVDMAIRSDTGYLGTDHTGETTATLLDALHNQRTPSEVFYRYDAPAPDMNVWLEFPDGLVSEREVLERSLAAPEYLAAFPGYDAILQEELDTLEGDGGPSPYYSGAVIGQPIWEYAQHEGYPEATRLYLQALRERSGTVGYPELANLIVHSTCELGPAPGEFFRQAYQERGLTIQACP